MNMETETLYERLGPENLQKLVNAFYDLVFSDPEIKDLFKTDKELIKKKQFMFLTQFLGGPALYSDAYGHPQMRARHLPHPISEDKAVAWLKCMHAAIDTLAISDELKTELFDRFPPTAFFMVNS
jgi:hemoglobin